MAKQDNKDADDVRAKRTLYVTGFNSDKITKKMLKELFTQGGPVADITMFDTHAYVRFQHPESVPYCLALFNDIELFGNKLRLNPRHKSENTFSYMRYLTEVRNKLRDEYMRKEPPNLPAKKYPDSPKNQKKWKSERSDRNRRDFETKSDGQKKHKISQHQHKKTKKSKRGSQRNQPQKSKSIH